jgi:hypothetical protein
MKERKWLKRFLESLLTNLKESIRADTLLIIARYESLVPFDGTHDPEEQRQMIDILITLQNNVTILSNLQRAWPDHASLDYAALISALEECKVDGLFCLDRWQVPHPLSATARKAMPREWKTPLSCNQTCSSSLWVH